MLSREQFSTAAAWGWDAAVSFKLTRISDLAVVLPGCATRQSLPRTTLQRVLNDLVAPLSARQQGILRQVEDAGTPSPVPAFGPDYARGPVRKPPVPGSSSRRDSSVQTDRRCHDGRDETPPSRGTRHMPSLDLNGVRNTSSPYFATFRPGSSHHQAIFRPICMTVFASAGPRWKKLWT